MSQNAAQLSPVAERSPLLHQVTAALLIPRNSDGSVNTSAFRGLLQFLVQKGIRSFAVNGATGEYLMTTPAELKELLRIALDSGSCTIIAGVGAASTARAQELVAIAQGEGAHGLLVPVPCFFPYEQDDIQEFFRSALTDNTLPAYLYNLPSFTSPIAPATALATVRELPCFAGVKDSSGSLEMVSLLKSEAPGSSCILGNDGALHGGLAAGVCDGVVSGVSCVLPELMLRAYQAFAADPQSADAVSLKKILDDFIAWLDRFPVPWGLRIAAEARGLTEAWYPIPLSPARQQLRKEFISWIELHRQELLLD